MKNDLKSALNHAEAICNERRAAEKKKAEEQAVRQQKQDAKNREAYNKNANLYSWRIGFKYGMRCGIVFANSHNEAREKLKKKLLNINGILIDPIDYREDVTMIGEYIE